MIDPKGGRIDKRRRFQVKGLLNFASAAGAARAR